MVWHRQVTTLIHTLLALNKPKEAEWETLCFNKINLNKIKQHIVRMGFCWSLIYNENYLNI